MKWFEFFNKWKMKKKKKKPNKQTNNREALSVLILQEIIHGFVLLDKQCPKLRPFRSTWRLSLQS